MSLLLPVGSVSTSWRLRPFGAATAFATAWWMRSWGTPEAPSDVRSRWCVCATISSLLMRLCRPSVKRIKKASRGPMWCTVSSGSAVMYGTCSEKGGTLRSAFLRYASPKDRVTIKDPATRSGAELMCAWAAARRKAFLSVVLLLTNALSVELFGSWSHESGCASIPPLGVRRPSSARLSPQLATTTTSRVTAAVTAQHPTVRCSRPCFSMKSRSRWVYVSFSAVRRALAPTFAPAAGGGDVEALTSWPRCFDTVDAMLAAMNLEQCTPPWPSYTPASVTRSPSSRVQMCVSSFSMLAVI
eukprot:PhM_4_TR17783/c0_g1_i1/m.103780